jgi:hypothetical protein
MPSPELIEAMGKYIQELIAARIMHDGGGLQPSSKGASRSASSLASGLWDGWRAKCETGWRLALQPAVVTNVVRIEDRKLPDTYAIPKKTANARSTATRVSSCNLPIVVPTLSRGTVCALSTMTCDFFRRPLSVFGSIEILSSGAVRSSLVTGRTVTDARVSNRSD